MINVEDATSPWLRVEPYTKRKGGLGGKACPPKIEMKAKIIMAIILAFGLAGLSGCVLLQELSGQGQGAKVLINYALASNGATVSSKTGGST